MTPEQINRLCAELDGLKAVEEDDLWSLKYADGRYAQYPRGGISEEHCWRVCCPDYTTSYDAIIPLIQKQQGYIAADLFMWLNDQPHIEYPEPLYATPRQLCEALLRALGKWEETQ